MDELLAECRRQSVMPRHRFELAAYAILGKGNTKKAMNRLLKMRKIEAENKVDSIDTATAGQVSEKGSPGCFLCSGRDGLGRPSWFLDYAAFKPSGFHNEYEWNCLIKTSLDTFDALTTTIKEIREGCVMLAACKGMGWQNFSFEMEKRFSAIYQDGYPIRIKAIYLTDPPVIISAIIKLCRVFMKKKMADRLVTCSAADMAAGKVGNFLPDQLPPAMGGSWTESVDAWVERGLKRRAESIAELGPI
eukprot:2401609-Rhodomonas_salina.2